MTRRVKQVIIALVVLIHILVIGCELEGGSRNGCDVNNNCSTTTNIGV